MNFKELEPIIPFEVRKKSTSSDILKRMGKVSFQARTLSQALEVWLRMLKDETFIFMGLAGAMVPGGMRKIIAYLLENNFIDCLVTTGANLFHDLHETLGKFHYRGIPKVADETLFRHGIDRIYDTFAREEEFREVDRWVAEFVRELEPRSYTTREFLYLLGRRAKGEEKSPGILTTAYLKKIPLYCPALGDSSLGIALAYARKKYGIKIDFDLTGDVYETARMVISSPSTGVIFVGGGTPKNFIQQTQITASLLGYSKEGHLYALQITMDVPYWGGLSGATLEEGESWGKIAPQANKVAVYAEATLVLPFLVTALAEEGEELAKKRKRKEFF